MKRILAAAAVTAAMALAPAHAKPLSFGDYANGNEGGVVNGSSIDFGDGLVINFFAGSGLQLDGNLTPEFFPYFDSFDNFKPGGLGVCRVLDGTAGNGAPGAECKDSSDDSIDGELQANEYVAMSFNSSTNGSYDLRGLTFRDGKHNDITNSTGMLRVVYQLQGGAITGLDTTFAAIVAMAASGALDNLRAIAFGYLNTEFYVEGISDVPIPGAIPLLLSGLAGLGFASRKRKAA